MEHPKQNNNYLILFYRVVSLFRPTIFKASDFSSISTDQKTIVFRSENIENITPGWAAMGSYQLLNKKEFIETFELAESNGAFKVNSKVKSVRQ